MTRVRVLAALLALGAGGLAWFAALVAWPVVMWRVTGANDPKFLWAAGALLIAAALIGQGARRLWHQGAP